MQNHIKVINFPFPKFWSFFDYVEGRRNPIEEWFRELSFEGKQSFNTLLKNTHKIENHQNWGGFKYLKGEPKREKIWQLDFIADRKQHRLLGVFSGQKQAVLILGCYHKQNVYTPHDAMKTARKRAQALREGRADKVERQIRTDI